MSELNPSNWINNYGDLLYNFSLKRLNYNVEQAEDMVQDVLLNAWRSRETYNGTSSEKNWLMTICKNKIIDFYRKASHSKTVSFDNNNDENVFDSDGHFQTQFQLTKEWNVNANDKFEAKEFYSILEICKSKLKQIQEQVFTLKYIEDITTEEICEILGITNQNYWVLIHRAKIQLRLCLDKNWIKN